MVSQVNPHLDNREQEILKAVIETYISSGKPVGSRTLSKKRKGDLSPATIRNIMADLESAGYLCQPHTSAGRIPTDEGYRYYVDHLIESATLNKHDQDFINRTIFKTDSHDNVMERISQAIANATDNVGFVITPSLGHNAVKHLEFILLSDSQILVIIVSKSGLVHNRIVKVDEHVTQQELDQTARYVNENYSGWHLLQVRNDILRKMGEEKALYDRLLKNVILLCNQGLIDEVSEQDVDIYVDGASKLVGKPEFSDSLRMRALFKTFEEKSKLVKILNACISDKLEEGIRIIIGSENRVPGLRDYTLITSPLLCPDHQLGSVGILGPTRLQYARAITVVDYVARLYGQILTTN
jgi:heat-inducible transcriptional repressor